MAMDHPVESPQTPPMDQISAFSVEAMGSPPTPDATVGLAVSYDHTSDTTSLQKTITDHGMYATFPTGTIYLANTESGMSHALCQGCQWSLGLASNYR